MKTDINIDDEVFIVQTIEDHKPSVVRKHQIKGILRRSKAVPLYMLDDPMYGDHFDDEVATYELNELIHVDDYVDYVNDMIDSNRRVLLSKMEE